MAALIGSFFGVVLGSALLGAALAWLLRKLLPISIIGSYAIGAAAMTVVYALAGQTPQAPFDEGVARIAFHAFGGVLGFALLWLTAGRRKTGVQEGDESRGPA